MLTTNPHSRFFFQTLTTNLETYCPHFLVNSLAPIALKACEADGREVDWLLCRDHLIACHSYVLLRNKITLKARETDGRKDDWLLCRDHLIACHLYVLWRNKFCSWLIATYVNILGGIENEEYPRRCAIRRPKPVASGLCRWRLGQVLQINTKLIYLIAWESDTHIGRRQGPHDWVGDWWGPLAMWIWFQCKHAYACNFNEDVVEYT